MVVAAAVVIHLFDRFYFHQTEQFQISYLKSNIPPILLYYLEIFWAKNENSQCLRFWIFSLSSFPT